MIEICTHIWAEYMPHYAQVLRYHLAGPLQFPPAMTVQFTICYTESDAATVAVLDEYASHNSDRYRIVRLPLPLDLLGRRHYGRDLAAQRTRGDLIWMADGDYYFGAGCLDALYRAWQGAKDPRPTMYTPAACLISHTHAIGDMQIARASPGSLPPPPDRAEFARVRQTRAIGGTFIVDGDYARTRGYLRGGKWLPPWRGSMPPFASTRDDVSFRKRVTRDGVVSRVALPELYRLRHSTSTVNNAAYRAAAEGR